MHEVAESGVAAHWMYKQGRGGGTTKKDGDRYEWLRELVEEVRRQTDPKELVRSVKEVIMTSVESSFACRCTKL